MTRTVEASTEIGAPVGTVYGYWADLENLPRFMSGVEEVRSVGPDRTRWKVKGPLGKTLQWEARTVQREPNRALGWSADAGDVGTSGTVLFREMGRGRTRIEVTLRYADPPGGRAGERLSKAAADPELQLRQDLDNLKDILEGRATPEEVRSRPAAVTLQSVAALILALALGAVAVSGGVFLLRRLWGRGVAGRGGLPARAAGGLSGRGRAGVPGR